MVSVACEWRANVTSATEICRTLPVGRTTMRSNRGISSTGGGYASPTRVPSFADESVKRGRP